MSVTGEACLAFALSNAPSSRCSWMRGDGLDVEKELINEGLFAGLRWLATQRRQRARDVHGGYHSQMHTRQDGTQLTQRDARCCQALP